MSLKKISFGFFSGYLSLAVEGFSSIVTVSMLVNFVGVNKASVWILCLSFYPLLGFAQSTLGPAIIRRASLSTNNFSAGESSIQEASKIAYRIVNFLLAILLAIVYVFYFSTACKGIINSWSALILFCLFSLGLLLRIPAVRRFHLLAGSGYVGLDKAAQSCSTLSILAVSYFLMSLHPNIIYMAVAFIAGSAIYLILSLFCFKRLSRFHLFKSPQQLNSGTVISIFAESGGLAVLAISSLIVFNMDVWLIQSIVGLSVLPAFVMQSKIVSLVVALSTLLQQVAYPYIASFSVNDQKFSPNTIYNGSIFASLSIAFVGFSILLVISPALMALLVGSGSFLGWKILTLQIIFGLLIVNHIACSSPILALGENPFLVPSIINPILSLLFGYVFGVRMGIEGVVLGNIIGTLLPSVWVVTQARKIFLTKFQ